MKEFRSKSKSIEILVKPSTRKGTRVSIFANAEAELTNPTRDYPIAPLSREEELERMSKAQYERFEDGLRKFMGYDNTRYKRKEKK